MRKKGSAVLLLIVIVSTLVITGCTRKLMWAGNSGKDHIEASYKRFTGTEKKKIRIEEGDTLVINYQSDVTEGALAITITDPDGNEVISLATDTEGAEGLEANESGKYTLNIQGDKTGGSFTINWSFE